MLTYPNLINMCQFVNFFVSDFVLMMVSVSLSMPLLS
ncbi:hypothetical protein SAMN05421882_1005113 [Nitrosomonas communis]|uniref:Uncharacterized protein n=1 Tax=Nitrosomonas communis TaxID=44574 RepID=A0A1H2RW02_9PROT|nr:hypothetical protein SAMN05421882_1005113 [Nitrosomonas communis]